jgi:hypothetical protein
VNWLFHTRLGRWKDATTRLRLDHTIRKPIRAETRRKNWRTYPRLSVGSREQTQRTTHNASWNTFAARGRLRHVTEDVVRMPRAEDTQLDLASGRREGDATDRDPLGKRLVTSTGGSTHAAGDCNPSGRGRSASLSETGP